jgi:glycosyltransferase involved in cell wall biosynthesis
LLYGSATNGKQTIQLAKEFDIPVIFRVLDVAHGFVKIPLARQLAKKYEKYVISRAQLVLATTPHLARYAGEMGAKQGLVEPFSLGINMKDFKPLAKDPALAKAVNIQDGDAVIAFIGTLFPFSGLDNIISNFEVIQEKTPSTKFLIIGGGPAFNRLLAMVKRKKLESSVMLLGFKNQKELPRYLALADICVNPFEINYVTRRILPTKILEYLSCGKPVLSTPLEGTKELLPDESYGIVYASSTEFVKSLADLITKKEKLAELGKNGYFYVRKNHDWEVLCDKLLEKFQSLIAKNNDKHTKK